jgi:hypothetical protein
VVDVNEQNVDRSVWPIHHRWRAINKALDAGLLTLSEVENSFQLEVVEVEQLPEEEGTYATKV